MTDKEAIGILYPRFGLDGKIGSVEPFGKGNINSTFLVKGGGKEYIFQKVNTGVFRKPEEVMENAGKILKHIDG